MTLNKDTPDVLFNNRRAKKVCLGEIQIWPRYLVLEDLENYLFTYGINNAQSISVAKTPANKYRIAIGNPDYNNGIGSVIVLEYDYDFSSPPEVLNFGYGSTSVGVAVGNIQTNVTLYDNPNVVTYTASVNVPQMRFGQSVALSSNGEYLVVGAPCSSNLDLNTNLSYGDGSFGFIRVYRYSAVGTSEEGWYFHGNHFSAKSIYPMADEGGILTDRILAFQDNTRGFLWEGGYGLSFDSQTIASRYKFLGWKVGISDDGNTVYASAPKSDGLPSLSSSPRNEGVILKYTKSGSNWTREESMQYADQSGNLELANAYFGSDFDFKAGKIVATTAPNNYNPSTNYNLFTKNGFMRWLSASEPLSPTSTSRISSTTPNGADSIGAQKGISLSGDGNFVAIGYPNSGIGGEVKIYDVSVSIGSSKTISTTKTGIKFGGSVCLNHDGTLLVVGSPLDDYEKNYGESYADSVNNGSVLVYKKISGEWEQYCELFLGSENGGQCGYASFIDPDGRFIVFSSPFTGAGGGIFIKGIP